MKLVYKIIIPIALILAGAVFFVAYFSKTSMENSLIQEEFFRLQELVLKHSPHLLKKEYFLNPTEVPSQTAFKEFADSITTSSTARFSIWNKDQVIAYSGLKSIIGLHSPEHEDLKRLFREGLPFFLVKSIEKNKPVHDDVGKFLDINMPIRISGELVGAVEIHSVMAGVLGPVAKQLNFILYLLVGSSAVIFVLVFFVIKFFVIRPIVIIEESADAMAKGDLDHEVLYKSSDEIGILAADFEVMREELKIAMTEAKKLSSIVEESFEGVSIVDMTQDYNFIYVNKAWEKLTGWSNEDVLNKQSPRILKSGKQDVDFYKKLWDTILAGEIFTTEIINKKKDGSLYNAELAIIPIKDGHGKITLFAEISKDITGRKQLEESLKHHTEEVEAEVEVRTLEVKEEQARLLASINSISLGFVIVDKENNILLKNFALMSILGLTLTEEPKTLADVAKYLVGIDLVSLCTESIATNKTVEHKVLLYGKKFLRVSCAPVSDGQNVIGNVVLIEDITEAKVMERSRDEFFAVASHELRTPLTAIRGNTEMILDMYADKITDQDVKEMLSDINEASVRLIGIVNDFLEVSRLEHGSVSLENVSFDVVEIIEKVVKSTQKLADEKSLLLKFNKQENIPGIVFADRGKVEQILFNLIGNAIKFTAKGGVTVSIDTIDALVYIKVTDTGPGISPQNESLLFRKFQPAGEQMLARDVSKSTGLGLFISKLLIEKMGGTIGLEKSTVGEGSVFFFTLPSTQIVSM